MKSSVPIQPAVPPDHDVRTRVLDPSQSFIVQAPAGSGKTELLMQRYLGLLGQRSVEQPESVLAITFTKKAAAEMRARVLQALEAAGQPEPEEPHKRVSHELAKAAAARDRAMGWDILRNPSRLQIRTVDSFCDQIVRRTPLLGSLGPTPSIATDFLPLYREAAERTLRMIGDADPRTANAVSQILLEQDNDLRRVSALLVRLLEKRDQWLRILGRSDSYSPEQLANLRSALENSLAAAVRHELEKVRDAFAGLSRNTLSCLLGFAQYAAGNVDPVHFVACLRSVERLPGTEPSELPKWVALRHFCLNADHKFWSALNNRHGFPPTDRRRRDDCQEFLKNLNETPEGERIKDALCLVDRIPPSRYRDEQWKTLEALFRVLPLAVANLRVVFSERSVIDYIEVAQAALAALGSDEHPTDLALGIGYRVQHVLVDEFQDTSISQLRLLERLVRAWTGENPSTLFVVGDPMQSIYSFRQAEVTLFEQVRTKGVAEWALEAENLTANFRSAPALVEWFNTAFSQILTDNNPVTGAVQYAGAIACAAQEQEKPVFLHSAPANDLVAEANAVVSIVREEIDRGTGSIALLVRARTHLKSIVPQLREAGIRFRAREIDLLGERQTVRDLHAVTRAILHLADRISWLAVLRSPSCGLELADLWELTRGDSRSTVWELLHTRAERLSSRAQEVLARVLPVFEAALQERGRRSLRCLVESLWISLGSHAGLGRGESEAAERDAAAYFDLLQRVETGGEIDETQLQDALDTLYAPPDTSDGIQLEVMTIHGAKGLEFDTVILPGLNRIVDRNRKQLLNWRERILDGQDGLLLAPLEPVGPRQKTATIAGYIQALANDASAEEGKRLLYVAATRARHRLHLVSTVPESGGRPHRDSFLSYLWNVPGIGEFPQMEEAPERPAPPRIPQVLHRIPAGWTAPVPAGMARTRSPFGAGEELEPPQHTFDWVRENMRRVGTVTHRMLQQIGREGIAGWNSQRIEGSRNIIRALLSHEGVPPPELGATSRQVMNSLLRTIEDERGRWLLSRHEAEGNELELSSILDGRLVRVKLDRTFVDADGLRWVIDYKTTSIEGGSRDQYVDEQVKKYTPDLERYARIMRQYEARPVRAGLYFPLMGVWREVNLSRDNR